MKGLFISEQHRQTISYRTGPFYRGTFYLLFVLLAMQFPAAALYLYQDRIAESIRLARQRIQKERVAITADEQKVAPLRKRIEQVSGWQKIIAERKRVASALSRIEAAIPKNVCLHKVSVTNTAPDVKSSDRLEIKMSGWYTAKFAGKVTDEGTAEPGIGPFMEALKEKFSDSTVTQIAVQGKASPSEPLQPGIAEFALEIVTK